MCQGRYNDLEPDREKEREHNVKLEDQVLRRKTVDGRQGELAKSATVQVRHPSNRIGKWRAQGAAAMAAETES